MSSLNRTPAMNKRHRGTQMTEVGQLNINVGIDTDGLRQRQTNPNPRFPLVSADQTIFTPKESEMIMWELSNQPQNHGDGLRDQDMYSARGLPVFNGAGSANMSHEQFISLFIFGGFAVSTPGMSWDTPGEGFASQRAGTKTVKNTGRSTIQIGDWVYWDSPEVETNATGELGVSRQPYISATGGLGYVGKSTRRVLPILRPLRGVFGDDTVTETMFHLLTAESGLSSEADLQRYGASDIHIRSAKLSEFNRPMVSASRALGSTIGAFFVQAVALLSRMTITAPNGSLPDLEGSEISNKDRAINANVLRRLRAPGATIKLDESGSPRDGETGLVDVIRTLGNSLGIANYSSTTGLSSEPTNVTIEGSNVDTNLQHILYATAFQRNDALRTISRVDSYSESMDPIGQIDSCLVNTIPHLFQSAFYAFKFFDDRVVGRAMSTSSGGSNIDMLIVP